MSASDRWLLPEGVEEILPSEAARLETLRRELLDLYSSWGYELVITPLIEYLDSLLVGSSHDLDLHTFKLTDQLSGRLMGLRADITPQVARIDANRLVHQDSKDHDVSRLCYADNVVHTKPRALLSSRVPIRIGAELFGHAGVGCDIELIGLMYETLRIADVGSIHIVLGHVGIFRSLINAADVSEEVEAELFSAMQRKAYGELDGLLEERIENIEIRQMLADLSRLSGDESVLDKALDRFAGAPETVKQELAELESIAKGIKARIPELSLGFDLCELRGYEYHTGIVFAAYTPGYGQALAQGGRFNDIGKVFGLARPASGFDSDLKVIARLSKRDFTGAKAIAAPWNDDLALAQLIKELRQQGQRVIVQFDAGVALSRADYDRQIIKDNEKWQVSPL
ncbi:MAG: ATP phosphoribosyltransferase regulatory subunit [Pseudohongiellaceae bacterium]|nr:ATP phosphoribosyltransferase regulatory subunit [Pseudohongiellaceae bacterium]